MRTHGASTAAELGVGVGVRVKQLTTEEVSDLIFNYDSLLMELMVSA